MQEWSQKELRKEVQKRITAWPDGLAESTQKAYIRALDQYRLWLTGWRKEKGVEREGRGRVLEYCEDYEAHLRRLSEARKLSGATCQNRMLALINSLIELCGYPLFDKENNAWAPVSGFLPGMIAQAEKQAGWAGKRNLALLRLIAVLALPAQETHHGQAQLEVASHVYFRRFLGCIPENQAGRVN